MARMPLGPGDEIDAVVTTLTPFGVLVETTSGIPGRVRGADEAVGTVIHVQVLEFDDLKQRFSARLA